MSKVNRSGLKSRSLISKIKDWQTRTYTPNAPLFHFALLFLVAILLFIVGEQLSAHLTTKKVLEHGASALVLDLQISEKLREWDGSDEWKDMNANDKGWMLNYVWASSRCEEPMYTKLERLLLTTDDQ